jgi:hypothetical protein
VDTAAFLLAAGFGFGLSLLRISDGTVPEIALAVGEGRPNAEIGGQLYLSVPTRQDAHLAHPHQAGPEQPGADRPVGPRRRPAARRGLNTQR